MHRSIVIFTIGLDTGAGKGGFLTTIELPSLRVYESPRP